MADIEIERKFLLLPCIPQEILDALGIAYTKESLEQFYVPTEASPFTRYRQKGDTFYKTIKTGEGMVRQEYESKVSQEEYLSFRASPSGRIITKERYTFAYQNHTYELDTFHGTLEGLCYLEIEFKNEQEAQTFTLPPVFETLLVCEVTFDKDFNNASLANVQSLPLPKLQADFVHEKRGIRKLSAFLPVDQALTGMVYTLAKSLQKHRRHLIKDPSDVEELHQFRVELRKLRALLKEFKDFFAPDWYQKHYKQLSILMKKTNKKRDNDVAMIDMGSLCKQLDSKDKTLKAIKHSLRQKNKKLEVSLIKLLKSDTLKNELKLLVNLAKYSNIFLPASSQPLILIAIGIIHTRIETILEDAAHICEDTQCDTYHELRIDFKKLRYVVELLEPLAQQERFKTVLEKLKSIQTLLGDINDFHMQQAQLDTFKQEMKKEKKSLGKLQEKMKAKEEKNKDAFGRAILRFKEERRLYETLLYRSEPITL